MNFNLINVGIAECKTASAPDILRTILGSCVGICCYDSTLKIGGLAHIMLPVNRKSSSSISKYADTAIPYMISEMEKMGGDKKRFTAKIVGGATMFNLSENSMMSEIGRNNVTMVRQILSDSGISLLSEDVGGDYGRTIDFVIETGEVRVRSMGRNEKVI
jgi:chemotaxis protein CheD